MSSSQFPQLDEAGWQKLARRTWREEAGKLVSVYDPALLKTLELIDLEAPLPSLWPQFEALAHVPVLVVEGLVGGFVIAFLFRVKPELLGPRQAGRQP